MGIFDIFKPRKKLTDLDYIRNTLKANGVFQGRHFNPADELHVEKRFFAVKPHGVSQPAAQKALAELPVGSPLCLSSGQDSDGNPALLVQTLSGALIGDIRWDCVDRLQSLYDMLKAGVKLDCSLSNKGEFWSGNLNKKIWWCEVSIPDYDVWSLTGASVWTTESGSVYHCDPACNKKATRYMTEDEAKYRGMKKCSRCYHLKAGKPVQETPGLLFPDFVVIDVETTGLSESSDKVIQVAAVRYINHKMFERFVSYVNPGRPIPAEASRVNGITDKKVRMAPGFKSIQNQFFSFIELAPLVVGYNVSFDLKFLSAESGIDLFTAWDHMDVLPLAREALPMLPNYKLATVSQHIGFDTNFHDALSDCRACGEVLNYICRNELIEFRDGEFFLESNHTFSLPTTQEKDTSSHSVQRPASAPPSAFCGLSEKDFKTALGYWTQGEEKRTNGDIETAIKLFDLAHEIGYKAPVIFDSYAKAYRKLKDFEKEIEILDEAIGLFSGPIADSFAFRKERAKELMLAQQKRVEMNAQKAIEKEQKAELRRRKKEMEAAKPKKSNKRAVIQYTDDGTIVKEFESIAAAAQECGINSKCIRDAACGRQKHAGGFCWKYVSTDGFNEETEATIA